MPAISPRDRDDLALRPPECLEEAALVSGLDADALAPGAKTRRQAGRFSRLLRADENDGDVGFDGASLRTAARSALDRLGRMDSDLEGKTVHLTTGGGVPPRSGAFRLTRRRS